MKAIRVERTGGPEVMEVVERATPSPGPGEVLVRVLASGVNFIDIYFRSGAYARELPFVPGEEGAGVVEALGPGVPGVSGLSIGQTVAWASAPGSYATHVAARADRLVPVPSGVPAKTAAAAMLQGMTAHYLARSTFPLASGHTCLVHAAAGGVGLLLVQMAKRAGARVIATTSTDEKAKLARDAGADDVILYDRGAPFDEQARAGTGGLGVDVVYDSVGLSTFDRSLLSLRPRGMLVLFGQSSGKVPPLDLQRLNAGGSLFVTRPTLAHYVASSAELLERAGDLLGAIQSGALRVRVHGEYRLEEAASAHRDLASRATSGKLLLVPGA